MNVIVKATKNDLLEIAKVHKKVYSKSHFTSLFSLELLEVFYGYFISNDSVILLQLDIEKNIQGFIVFGEGIPEKIKQFKADERYAIWKTASLNPVRAIKKATTQIYNKLFISNIKYEEANCLILSIAVLVQQKGIGGHLLEEARLLSQKLNYSSLGLYVRVENIVALNLYLKHKFKIVVFASGQYYMQKEY